MEGGALSGAAGAQRRGAPAARLRGARSLLVLALLLPFALAAAAAAVRPASGAAAAALVLAALGAAAGGFALLLRRLLVPLEALGARIAAAGAGDPPGPAGGAGRAGLLAPLHRALEAALAGERADAARALEEGLARQGGELARRHREELEEAAGRLAAGAAELARAEAQAARLAAQLAERDGALARERKHVSALNRVGVALGSELDIDRLVQLIINVSVKGLRVEIGQIMLVEERTGELALRAATGLPAGFDPRGAGPWDGVSGTVARTGRPVLLRSVDGSARVAVASPWGLRRRSVLCVPIRAKERLLGTIELTNRKGGEGFSEEDLAMLASIASQAGVALENANLYRELQASYLETVRALVQAVEEKDRYTRGHSERVTTFSEKIARRMGLGERQVRMLQYAGVLHDIGKIGIDLAILQKRERLTPAEFDAVKRHPLVGERIIAPIGFLRGALAAVAQHHERFDGRGYPLGLTGEKMALEARILAVADAYDAMITERPYRRPLPKGDAVAELRRCSGTQFDPLVVEQFLELLASDPEIRDLEERLATVGT